VSIRYVGEVGQNFGAASASTITFTSSRAVPVGDIVILAARGGGTVVVNSVSDGASNTWVKLGNTTTANTCNVWYSVLTTAFTTSTVVTVTYSGTPSNRIVGAWAFDGITRPTTVTELASGSAVTTLSPASLTVPQYGSLFFSAISVAATPTWTDPTGFTALPVTSSTASLRAAYLIRSSMSSVSTTWSWNPSGNAGVVSGSFTPDGGDFFNIF